MAPKYVKHIRIINKNKQIKLNLDTFKQQQIGKDQVDLTQTNIESINKST